MNSLRVILLTCASILLVTFGTVAQWIQTNGPYGGRVETIAVDVDGRLFVAGNVNPISFSTDGGNSWIHTLIEANAIAVNSSAHIFVGYDGIKRSTDHGTTWTNMNNGLSGVWIKSIAISQQDIIFAGTSAGEIYRSTDNGESWTRMVSNLSSSYVNCLAINVSGVIFAGTSENGHVFRSIDNGENWTLVRSGSAYDYVYTLAINSNGHIFAGSGNTGVSRSMDNGDTWVQINNGLTITNVTDLAINSNGTIFASAASGNTGGVFCSTDNGESWIKTSSGIENPIATALGISTYDIIYAGTEGGIFTSTNDGSSWNDLPLKATMITSLATNSSDHIFAGVYCDGVARSTDNGTSWTRANNGLTGLVTDAVIIDGNGYVFAGSQSGIFRSTNEGANWTQANITLASGQWPWIWSMVSKSNGYLFGGGSVYLNSNWTAAIFRSTDNGMNWIQTNSALSGYSVRSIAISSNGDVFAGGDVYPSWTGTIFQSMDNGDSWNQLPYSFPSQVSSLTITPAGIIFAGTMSHGVYRSTDNGVTWTQENNGLLGSTVLSLTTNSAGTVFLGTYFNGVFYSIDNGASWTQRSEGLGNAKVKSLALSTDGYIYAGTYSVGVWRRPVSEMMQLLPSVATTSATNVTSFAATLNGLVNPNGSLTSAYFEWGTDNTLSTFNTIASQSIGSVTEEVAVAATLNVFDANTTYYYRAVGENNQGVQRGSILSFTTPLVMPPALSGYGTATIDGVLNTTEWELAAKYELTVKVPHGGTTPAVLYVMNDLANLYLALRFERSCVDPGNSLFFEFDNDNDGIAENGDDVLGITPPNFYDEFRTNLPPCTSPFPAACGFLDLNYGGSNDGSGAFSNDGTVSVYEMSHPLKSGDVGHDFALIQDDTIGYCFMLRMAGPGSVYPDDFADTFFPGWRNYAQIIICKPTARQVIGSIIKEIDELAAGKILNKIEAQLLKLPLNQALANLERGRNNLAIAYLRAFVVEVRLAIRLHMLTESQAQPLIDGANAAIDLIKGPLAKRAGGALEDQLVLDEQTALEEQPGEFKLAQNYPNPFNPVTTISFSLPVQSYVSIKVYDATGKEVAVLLSEELPAGRYSRQWNASLLPSGVYFYRMQAGSFVETKKLILLK